MKTYTTEDFRKWGKKGGDKTKEKYGKEALLKRLEQARYIQAQKIMTSPLTQGSGLDIVEQADGNFPDAPTP